MKVFKVILYWWTPSHNHVIIATLYNTNCAQVQLFDIIWFHNAYTFLINSSYEHLWLHSKWQAHIHKEVEFKQPLVLNKILHIYCKNISEVVQY